MLRRKSAIDRPIPPTNLEDELRRHLTGNGVAYLLGAGASHLNGRGHPFAKELGKMVLRRLPRNHKMTLLETAGNTLEDMLNELNVARYGNIRDRVVHLIRKILVKKTPPLHVHRRFVRAIAKRGATGFHSIIFTTNYDTMIEEACDSEKIPVFEGFLGYERTFFEPRYFNLIWGCPDTTSKGKGAIGPFLEHPLFLIKLHGSLTWWNRKGEAVRLPKSIKSVSPLMIPPDNRKIESCNGRVFNELRTYFSDRTGGRKESIKRLVTVGYGFSDVHINTVIRDGIDNQRLYLISLVKEPSGEFLKFASRSKGVLAITESGWWLDGRQKNERTPWWDFKKMVGLMEES